MDQDGSVVSGTDPWPYQESSRAIAGLDDLGKRAKWFCDVKRKVTGGGNPEKIDLLLADVEMGHVKLADAEKKLAGVGELTAEQKAMVEALRTRDEVKPTVDKLLDKGSSGEQLTDAGKTFFELRKAGKPGPSGGRELELYWRCLILYAGNKEKDAAAVEEGIKALKAKFGESTGSSLWFTGETWKQFFERQDKWLEQLKAAQKPTDK